MVHSIHRVSLRAEKASMALTGSGKKIWSTSLVVSDNGTYFYNADDLLER